MSLTLAIIITVIAVVLSGFFSGSEIAYVQSSKVRMEIDGAQGGMINRIIRGFSRHEDMFISTLLVGNNIVLVIYGIAFSAALNPWLENITGNNDALVLLINTIVSTAIILIGGEFLPKTTFRINPNLTMRLLALPLFLVYWVLYPVSWFVSEISRLLMKLFHLDTPDQVSERLSIDEIDSYIQQQLDDTPSHKEVENEVKIFRNAIDFADTQIEQCMIPRREIIAVPLEGTSRDKLLKVFMATGLSKVVVYKEDIDDIVGYIHISELFNPQADWTLKIKPVIFTPSTMLAKKMMRRLMSEKKSMAIVIDEFGGTAGLATLEDLVEEIFGEIEDEHDRRKLIAREVQPGVYEMSGRVEISTVRDDFHIDIRESEEYHTLAGYILENLEALPKQGDTFDINGIRFTILRSTNTRIALVRLDTREQKED